MTPAIKTLTDSDAQALIRFALDAPAGHLPPLHNTRNALLLCLMLDAGLRVGEACRVHQIQLHSSAGPLPTLELMPSQTKTRTARSLPLTIRITQLAGILFAHLWKATPNFATNYALNLLDPSKPLPVRTAQAIVTRTGERALGRTIPAHSLRHTFASRLRRTADLRCVQALLGHASIRSTQIYTHPSADDLAKAIDTLNHPAP